MSLEWSPRIDHALQIAALAHEGQRRKSGGTPYISHPMAVALIVSEFTKDEDVQIAALLHDVLEDAPPAVYDATRMQADFGVRVLELVRGVSEEKTAGQPQAPWLERKQGYLQILQQAPEDCLLIASADKLHNLHSLCGDLAARGEQVWQHFNATAEQTLWFQRAVAEVIRGRLSAHLATRQLEAAVARLAELIEG